MKTTVERVDEVSVKLTVEVEAKKVKQAMDRAARELAKNVNLPGFRPGKAPRRLLEQRFGPGSIAQQALEDSLSDWYVAALEREDLTPVAQPKVDVEKFDENEGCEFTADIEIRPEIDLPPHEGIDVTFPDWDVADQDVDNQLAELRERFAEVDEVDRAAARGDYCTIDLVVKVGGEELEDAKVEDALYEVGSGGVTPNLDDAIQGRSAGEEFTYTDQLPDTFPEHAGEEAEFTVTVKDVREKTLPALDDDFAETASEFETIDELRKDVRNNLLRRRIAEAQQKVRDQLLEAYLATVEVTTPPSMLSDFVDARRHNLEHQAEQFGMDLDSLLEAQGHSRDEWEEEAMKAAAGAVKGQLVLDALAEKLEMDVTPEDLDFEIFRHAQIQGQSPEQIAQSVVQNNAVGALAGDALRRKTITAMMDAANVEGAPDDQVLIELGMKLDPNAPEFDEDAASDDEPAAETGEEPEASSESSSSDSSDSSESSDSPDESSDEE